MDNLSLKLDSTLSKEINSVLKAHLYSTKTEFIRDAIRFKLKALRDEQSKERAWQALFALHGKFKEKGKRQSDEEFRALKVQAGEEYFDLMKKKFGLANQK